MEGFQQLNAAQTTDLLKKLHERRGTVLFKFPGSGVIRMKAAEKGWGQNILGARPVTLMDGSKNQVVTGNFPLDSDFYFFKAKVRIQKKVAHLQLVGEIFRLVRRKNSRVKIPTSVSLHLVTKRIGDRLEFLRGPLQDISLTGCKVAIHSVENVVQPGEIVTALLRYGSRKPITVTGTVKHQKKMVKGRYDQIFGIQFSKMDDPARFQSWLVDLHREVFAQA